MKATTPCREFCAPMQAARIRLSRPRANRSTGAEAGPAEGFAPLGAVRIDVFASDFTGLIHGDDIEHLDPGGERLAARVGEVEDHGPFEDPVVIAEEHPPFFETEPVPGEQLDTVPAKRFAS